MNLRQVHEFKKKIHDFEKKFMIWKKFMNMKKIIEFEESSPIYEKVNEFG